MALNRTLILEPKIDTFNQLLQPLSNTCLESIGHNRTHWEWNQNLDSYIVLDYPIIDGIKPLPEFLPLVIPQQISTQLQTLSAEPFILFIGNILKYLLRPNHEFEVYITEFKNRIQFNEPIVGIHVRRTDKIGTEATFHSMDEYMRAVNDFYNKIDSTNERNSINKKVERVVYLATDEPNVWKYEIIPYIKRGYIFKGNARHSESAGLMTRNTKDSIRDLIIDIIMLSECDFIVCTLSSQVCRLAVEVMQTRDPLKGFYSIDSNYYFGGQVFHGMTAIMSHKTKDQKELGFKIGDILGISEDKHNGYSYGNRNNGTKLGLYPRFKVEELVQSKKFAVFD